MNGIILARPSRVVLLLALVLAVILLTALVPALVAPASAADRGTIFKVGSDVNLPEGDTADAVIAIGGDVTIAGTVRNNITAVGGDVQLQPTANVGTEVDPSDTSIVLVGSDLTTASGATVRGDTSEVAGSWTGDLWGRGVDSVTSPLEDFWLFGWLGGTLLSLLAAIVIAALLPRQVTAISDRARRRFWPSLGWGALGAIVVVPVVTILLIVTIIGLLAILPWLFVVVATFVLGVIGVSVLIGEVILPRLNYTTRNLILAAVIGVLVLRLIALIPFAGAIVMAVAWIVGFGAAITALWSWQRHRRERGRGEGELREETAA